jgi:hypothetical protein
VNYLNGIFVDFKKNAAQRISQFGLAITEDTRMAGTLKKSVVQMAAGGYGWGVSQLTPKGGFCNAIPLPATRHRHSLFRSLNGRR